MSFLGRISGQMLKDNLLRYNVDLILDGNLMYWDTNNRRVGILNNTPGNTFSVNGTTTLGNIFISGNTIAATSGNLFLYSYAGNIDASNKRIGNIAAPVYSTDAATKSYVDIAVGTSEPNLTISDGTHTDNVTVNLDTLTFFGNTSQMNVYVTNNQVTFGFVSTPTFYNNVNINGNVITNLVGLVLTNSQPYITSIGNLTSLNVVGNISVNAVSAGQIGNTTTILAGTISSVNANQPNITSVGTLANLTTSGNITAQAANIYAANFIGNTGLYGTNYYWTNGATLATTITGTYSNSNVASYLLTYTGNLTAGNILVSGSISAYNVNANIYTNSITAFGANANVNINPTGSGIVAINSNSALLLPVGTSSNYPVTPISGMVRWNSTLGYLEVYTGIKWEAVGIEGGTTAVISDVFNTGDGNNTQFILSQNNTTSGALVSVNGVLQLPTTSYIISGNVITFNEAPLSTDIIEVRQYVPSTTVGQILNGNAEIQTVYINGIATSQFINDGLTTLTVDSANVNVLNTLQVSKPIVANVSNTAVNSSTVLINSFLPTLYRTAKYIINASNYGSNYFQSSEALVVHNGSTANISVYANTTVGTSIFTLSANIYNSNVSLWATTTTNGNNIKVSATYIPL